jgi:hypothetical protein
MIFLGEILHLGKKEKERGKKNQYNLDHTKDFLNLMTKVVKFQARCHLSTIAFSLEIFVPIL